jgi:hypothetical protein
MRTACRGGGVYEGIDAGAESILLGGSPSSGGSEGLSAEARALAVKIEVLEPADKRTAIPAEFFLEPCVSHRLPWMVVRIAQGMRTTENRVS